MFLRLVAVSCAFLLSMAATDAGAIDPDTPLADLQQRIWTRVDGVPGDPSHVTRTTDGFLWTFSPAGIHQFDGSRFEPFVPTEGPTPRWGRVRLARADDRGGLWIGYVDGGATHINAGKVRAWPSSEGPLAGFSVRAIAFDAGGRPYFGGTDGLLRLDDDGQWRRVPLHREGGNDGQVDSLSFAANGALWVMAQSGLWVRHGDQGDTFEKRRDGTPTAQIAGVVSAPNGDVYTWNMQDPKGFCRIHPDDRAGCWHLPGVAGPVFDREGAMWWGDQFSLFRVARPHTLPAHEPAALAEASERLPLGTNKIIPSADGSLWVATEGAIMRLRETPVRVARTPSGGLAASDDGELWLASFTRGLMRVGVAAPGDTVLTGQDETLWSERAAATAMGFDDGMTFARKRRPNAQEPVVLERYPGAGRGTNRIAKARDGALWISTIYPGPALSRLWKGEIESVPLPPIERGAAPRHVYVDAKGELWLGVQMDPRTPFFRRRGVEWQRKGGLALPEIASPNFSMDRADNIWLASDDSVHVYRNDRWRRFSGTEGLDVGAASHVVDFDGQVWLLGQQGIAAFTGDRFVTITGSGGHRFVGVTGLLQRANGDLWMFGADGIARIASNEWRRSLVEPGHQVAYTRLDHLDGISVSPMSGAPLPSVAETTDGRLWFAGASRLFWLDPDRLSSPRPPPPVVLRRLEVDGVVMSPRDGIRLPVGTSRISLSYAAPAAELAERTRFRYRLTTDDDAAPAWESAGDRHEVVYHKLPPGEYRFEIAASGRDGHWGESPTVIGFAIEPAFHQTRAFLALVTLAAMLLLAAAWIIRLRQVSMRIRAQMGARMAEREQISRDLHDTLLQGVQALLLNFQAIANRIPADDPLRQRMESALDRAQEVVREGRDRIGALRERDIADVDLTRCLERHGRELAAEAGVDFVIEASPSRPLRATAHEHLLQVGREALNNAFRHAGASRVWLHLDHGADGVRLVVADDGRGFPMDVQRDGQREGHWGLVGMRERAQLAGGSLELRSREEGGAEVAMWVPASLAYAGPARRSWLGLFRSRG